MKFEKKIEIRWADVDQNRHVRHSAYYDYGAFVRIHLIASVGYTAERLEKESIGPIIFHEECSFLKEIRPNDTVRVNMLKGELRPDGSRWTIHHEFFNSAGDKLAHLSIKGAWMDMEKRKLCLPPDILRDAFATLDEGQPFVYGK